MNCGNGLAIPGTTDSRFLYRSVTKHAPFRPLGYPNRVRLVSVSARLFNEGSVKADRSSFYELLGIPNSGTLPEIKKAYKQLARKYHPDVSPADRIEEHTERFIRVHEAYETLSDPRRRALYDQGLSKGMNVNFPSRRRCRQETEVAEEKSQWKNMWQVQLTKLRERSMNSTGKMSWGARMRRRKEEISEEPS